jgi:hypothetical protein
MGKRYVMASEFKPNEAGLDRFQKDVEALFAEINTRVRARLGRNATIDAKVDATAYEFSKIGVQVDKNVIQARYEELAREAQSRDQ